MDAISESEVDMNALDELITVQERGVVGRRDHLYIYVVEEEGEDDE